MIDLKKIRTLREGLGLSQGAAARAAGLGSAQRWNNIESGRTCNVTVETLGRIAKALKVKPADLLK